MTCIQVIQKHEQFAVGRLYINKSVTFMQRPENCEGQGFNNVHVVVNEQNDVLVDLGGVQYDVGNREDQADLFNCSPKKIDALPSFFPQTDDDSAPIPITVEEINNSTDDLPSSSTSNQRTASTSQHNNTTSGGSRRLWEFLRDLLSDNNYNPSHIKWVNRKAGEFKINKTLEIARMWGEKKNNSGMTYEKMSRAIRYYYKRKIMAPVLNRRLVYKFGPKSYGWQI